MIGNLLRKSRSVALVPLVLVAFLLAAPSVGFAQSYREFTGKIDKINKKKMIVDNRMGDKLGFDRTDATVVEGEKTEWDELKKGDWAVVSWKMMDKPRKAYKIVVQPPREDPGVDE